MTGRVVCFRPRMRRGIVRTECGDEMAFETNGDVETIQGDDLVEFVFVGHGTEKKAQVTRIVEKAASRCQSFDKMLQELFGGMNIERTTSK